MTTRCVADKGQGRRSELARDDQLETTPDPS